MPVFLSNYLTKSSAFPYIEVAQVLPLSSSWYQQYNSNAAPWVNNTGGPTVPILLNQKLYDTSNIGTFTLNTNTSGSIIIPAGRWAYNIRAVIGGSGISNSTALLGISSVAANDYIAFEHPLGSGANAAAYWNNDGEFVSTVPDTLRLVVEFPASVGAFVIGAPSNNNWIVNNAAYTIAKRFAYKRASLKLWKLD